MCPAIRSIAILLRMASDLLTYDEARRRVRDGEDWHTVAADFVSGLTLDEKLE